MGEISAVNQHREGDIALGVEGVLYDGFYDIFCFFLTVLNQNDGSVSVLVENEVEFELGASGVDFVDFDERRVSCLDDKEAEGDSE